MLRNTVAAASFFVLALTSAGCADDETDDAQAATTPTSPTTTSMAEFESESPSESEEPQDPYAPNLGERALKVGQTRKGQEVKTTLQEVKIPYPPGEYRQPKPGNVWLGLRVKQCLDQDAASSDYLHSYNHEWFAITKSGQQVNTNDGTWVDWPQPKFPEHQGMIPGRCSKGWMAISVPKGTRISSILWTPMQQPVAEWLPK